MPEARLPARQRGANARPTASHRISPSGLERRVAAVPGNGFDGSDRGSPQANPGARRHDRHPSLALGLKWTLVCDRLGTPFQFALSLDSKARADRMSFYLDK